MIPLYHDFREATVLVFGGGTVGARRARHVADADRVIVVGPVFPSSDYGEAELVRARPGADEVPGWLRRVDPTLVIAATDEPALNAAIERAAVSAGLLHNRVDRSEGGPPGSVIVPATVRDGSVSVAISTSGASPAVAGVLRERIEADLEGAARMVRLTNTLRTNLRHTDLEPSRRRAVVRAVAASDEVWKALRSGTDYPPTTSMRVVASALECSRSEAADLLAGDGHGDDEP